MVEEVEAVEVVVEVEEEEEGEEEEDEKDEVGRCCRGEPGGIGVAKYRSWRWRQSWQEQSTNSLRRRW